jgi:hypothetical protein
VNPKLRTAIVEFNAAQRHVVAELERVGVKRPASSTTWAAMREEARRVADSADLWIRPHGVGLSFRDSKWTIDFDFGKTGEIDGFDAHRLVAFARANSIGVEFGDDDEMRRLLAEAVDAGEVRFSPPINHYLTDRGREQTAPKGEKP